MSSDRYRNFDVAIYTRVYEVLQMADLNWLNERFEVMQRSMKVSKVYLETHRDMVVAGEEIVRGAKNYFEQRGVKVSGGITVTVNERNRFETYCYTNPAHRQKLKAVVEFTASIFDEIILDDFFFTSCKCESCIKAKGERSWTDFRLELMTEAAHSLVIEPARAINPKVELVIKYPNWYEHFQGLGFNLETEPAIFTRIYTGTETRDARLSNQHLQPYHGYSIVRYFENIKPGGNGGGWVDPFGMSSADRYAEQLWLTLFAKAPEITLFDFRSVQRLLTLADRASWQNQRSTEAAPSYDFDAAAQPARLPDGSLRPDATIALTAGWTFELVDSFLGKLGKPFGVACYRPYHSVGEDFLHSYLGMIGIPVDLRPEFPAEAPVVLLTESASFDPEIVSKIKGQLMAGKHVVITSGLLRALQGKGIEDIAELRYTDRKALVKDFLVGWGRLYSAERPVLLPQINYLTNDSWEEISGIGPYTGYPLLHFASYASGALYVLTIPENFSELYALPREVLTRIKETVTAGLPALLDAPGETSLFLYDNNTLIVESFRNEPCQARLIVSNEIGQVVNLLSGEALPAGEVVKNFFGQPSGKTAYSLTLAPHEFKVFELK